MVVCSPIFSSLSILYIQACMSFEYAAFFLLDSHFSQLQALAADMAAAEPTASNASMGAVSPIFVAAAASLALLLLPPLLQLAFSNWPTGGKKAKKLPPGPRGWPVVGNLFQVALAGKQLIHLIPDLSCAYGPIFTLRMGTRTLIVVTNADLAYEALIEKGPLFANRPPENPTRTVFSCNKFTVNSAVYGPEWRSLRRNMVSGMLSAARLRDSRAVRCRAMDRFIGHIRDEAASSGGAVWVLKNARFAVFCILLVLCFGVELDELEVAKIDGLMQKVLITLVPRMDDYLPLLAPFFSKQRREAMVVRKEQLETITPLINRRREMLKDADDGAASFSYLDSLLDLKVEGRSSTPDDIELVTLCSEFLNGGTDTTATAVEWAIARLIDNPSIQSRIHGEIQSVVGADGGPVDEVAVERMPYLQAFVKELLRKHPPTYFSLTHAAAEPGAKLGGYDVPMGANLEIFLPIISHDPTLWSKPEEFDPERFLGGGESADITGAKGVRMLPFGCGRRICPGMGMGTTHIALMVARMVQAFQWAPHPSQPRIDFTTKLIFTVVMNNPLLAAVEPRVVVPGQQ